MLFLEISLIISAINYWIIKITLLVDWLGKVIINLRFRRAYWELGGHGLGEVTVIIFIIFFIFLEDIYIFLNFMLLIYCLADAIESAGIVVLLNSVIECDLYFIQIRLIKFSLSLYVSQILQKTSFTALTDWVKL